MSLGSVCPVRTELEWWPGVELNHRHADFQSDNGGSRGLLISHLQRLPTLTPGSPRHNYGTPNPSSTRSWHSNASRLLRHDFAVFPDVKWRAIHARGFACILRRTTQGASDTRSKAPGPSCLRSRLCLHKFFSRSCGVGPELSYTAQLSARGRYNRSKFTRLLANLRTTSRRGTSWPPCRTRAAIRRSASWVVCSRRYTISTR